MLLLSWNLIIFFCKKQGCTTLTWDEYALPQILTFFFFITTTKKDRVGRANMLRVAAIRKLSLCSQRCRSPTRCLRSGANTEGPKGITGASWWRTPLINVLVLDNVIPNWGKKSSFLGPVQRCRLVYILPFLTPPNSFWRSFSSRSFVLTEAGALLVEAKRQVDWSGQGVLIKLILCHDPWPSDWQRPL